LRECEMERSGGEEIWVEGCESLSLWVSDLWML